MSFDPTAHKENRIVMFHGQETEARLAALNALLNELGIEADDLDTESLIADERSINEWFSSSTIIPFLSPYRIVVVRNLGRIDLDDVWKTQREAIQSEELKKSLKDSAGWLKHLSAQIPESGRVFLIGDAEMGDDEKQERTRRRLEKWAKALASAGAAVAAFNPLAAEKVPAFLRERAAAAGKKLSAASASLLSEMVGGKMTLAAEELDKLCLYVGVSESILEPDIKACVSPDIDYGVYKLVDAIIAGKTSTAVQELRTFYSQADKVEGEVFSRIFPTLARQLRLIWQARVCVEAGCAPSRPIASVLEQWPSKPNLGLEKEWAQTKAMNAARRLTFPKLTRSFAHLATADGKMKGVHSAFSSADTVEMMVLQISSECR